jgi:hypothetical protein
MFSNFKKRLGVLTAIAVMAALVPALSVSTASAAPATVASGGYKTLAESATYSACPASASVASAGFTDTTSTDVDCIAMYGITTGVTATTYEPTANVPRWQMALYLTRTASIAGHTLGSGADQGFTDISGYSAAIQTAINQLKQLGVTTGTTATTFSPDDNVTREQMAMFLDRLLAKTAVGRGGENDADALGLVLYVNSSDVGTGKYNYDDIDTGAVTFEGHNSINEIYALGITGDAKTVRAFNPATNITRATMATWLTNALGHTNARPAGLHIQAAAYSGFGNTAPDIHVTHRDSAFAPIAGTIVDVFDWKNAATVADNAAFSAVTGKCNTTYTQAAGSSLTECKVEAGDMATDSSGNIVAFNANTITAAKTYTIYAWTAAAGTTFVNTTHLDGAATIDVTGATAATNLLVSANLNAAAKTAAYDTDVQHGDSVTITATLASSVYGAVAQAGMGIAFTHIVKAANDSTVLSQAITTVATDANGQATFTFTQADPSTTVQAADDRFHTVEVGSATTLAAVIAAPSTQGLTQASSVDVAGTYSGVVANDFETNNMLGVKFQDTARAKDRVTLANNATSGLAAALVTTPTSRSATATVTDQYGDAITGDTVTFHAGQVALVSWANVSDIFTDTAHGLGDGDMLRFLDLTGATGAITNFVIDTTYYVDWLHADTFDLHPTSALGATVVLDDDLADASGVETVRAHHNFGSTDRVVGSNGIASFAWNDIATASGIEPVCATNLNGATGITEGCATFYRYVNPSGATLSGGLTDLAQLNECGAAVDGTNECMTPIVIDMAAQTALVKIDDEAVPAIGLANETLVYKYAWDSNDHFQVDGAPVSFEVWTARMTLHSASEAAGDIISLVGYQVLPGNVSLWNILGS